MLTKINNSLTCVFFVSFAEKNGGVDKGTNRKTPGDPRDSRPPRRKNTKKSKRIERSERPILKLKKWTMKRRLKTNKRSLIRKIGGTDSP